MSASKNKITPKDILASAKYHKGDILDFKANEFRDNKTKNKKAIYDVSWIPIYFKFVETLSNGNKQTKLIPLKKIEFSKVITSSGLKLPKSKPGDNIKCMLLNFKKLTWDDVYGGDYIEKPKKTVEEQNVEKSTLKIRINSLIENTNEFVEALDCIANGHKLLCDKLKQQASSLKFKIKKDKTAESIPIRSIRQTHRERKDEDGEASDDNDTILMQSPLYRIKVPVHDGQLVLSWFKKGTKDIETKDIIFDSRKTLIDDSGRIEYKPAKVKVNNKWQSLNTNNAGAFFTFKSEIAGTISFPEIIASKNGLSLANQFDMLLVRRHKAKQTYSDIDTTIARSMVRNPDSEDEDVVMTEDAPGNGEFKNQSNYQNSNEGDVGESSTRVPPTKSKKLSKEPQFSDSDDEVQTNSKNKSKPTTTIKMNVSEDETSQSDSKEEPKVLKKKPVVSYDDDDDDDEFDA